MTSIYARSLIASILLCISLACASIPAQDQTSITDNINPQPARTRKLDTPLYTGSRGAIIFILNQAADPNNRGTSEKIIRLFAENSVPLEVAVSPLNRDKTQVDFSYLASYVDAGIIDVSLDGRGFDSLNLWLLEGTTTKSPLYSDLVSSIKNSLNLLQTSLGYMPATCIMSSADYNQSNYGALQEAGLKIVALNYFAGLKPLLQPVNWQGSRDENGLCRFPITGDVSYDGKQQNIPAISYDDKSLLVSIQQSLQDFGAAVIEIQPAAIAGQDNNADPVKLAQLAKLVKSCQGVGEITTFQSWYRYATGWLVQVPAVSQRIMPKYNGGPAIIFRLDDVSKGWHEDVDIEIIKMFERNGVPLDLGVVAFASGGPTYELPWAKAYADKGVVGISVHGYDWTPCQLVIAQSGSTYTEVRSRLARASGLYSMYYGFNPVAFTVPTDFYDEGGYRAVADAGFKIFATHFSIEPHPSAESVDYFGRPDPRGMCRIPTAEDVCSWVSDQDVSQEELYGDEIPETVVSCNQTNFVGGHWGDVINISQPASIPDYCKYYEAWDEAIVYNDFSTSLCSTLHRIGVAAVSLHPDEFIDKDGKTDMVKLASIEPIIKWCSGIGTITTYEAWYKYTYPAR